tara:strand:+ start:20028 stop:20333 length:306 start_codon:yes stop_codon:yes gene_type:complete
MEGDSLKTQLAIQALELGQKKNEAVLYKMSGTLEKLVEMQKSHETFHTKVLGKFETESSEKEAINNRLTKVEDNQKWTARSIIGAVILAVISATVVLVKGA